MSLIQPDISARLFKTSTKKQIDIQTTTQNKY